MTNDITVVEQLLQSSYKLFKTSSTPQKGKSNSIETKLADLSPKSLALMKNDYELDFMKEIEEKRLYHMRLVEELKACEQSYEESEQSDEITKEFMAKKKILEEAVVSVEKDMEQFYQNGQETAKKLDEAILSVNEKELQDITEASKRFKRIVVVLNSEEASIIRKFKPFKSFSELQLRVEAWNPDFRCVLSIPNTSEVIGSQEELLFAYQDGPTESDNLTLELKLYAKQEKRNIDCVEDPEYQRVKHSGKWMPSEVALFKVGVQQCGWGNWKRISEVVDTRTTEQVKAFSKTQSGKSVKTELNFMPTLSKLADGLFEVSKNVSRVLEKEENAVVLQNEEE